jgi:shikimate kinase
VAAVLAGRLGGVAADLDAMVEERARARVSEIFDREGESGFRRRESEALAAAIESDAAVLATGGGVVLDPNNRTLLRERCCVVWLEVAPGEAARRLAADAASRPLLAGGSLAARLETLLRERAALYESVAEFRVPTGSLAPVEVADAILATVPPAPRSAP